MTVKCIYKIEIINEVVRLMGGTTSKYEIGNF